MRHARFFPLAFLANVHGFILLAPYLVIFLTVVRTVQMYTPASGNPKPETRNPNK
jgi:hypothetical protein